MPIQVSDAAANKPEYITEAAKTIGKGQRQVVFIAIYKGKKQIKTASDLVQATGLSRMQILQRGGELAAHGLVEKLRVDGEVAYKKIDFYQHTKAEILRLAENPAALARVATKRTPRPIGTNGKLTIRIDGSRARTRQITLDDIDSFSKAHGLGVTQHLPASVSERKFKKGIQSIIGQPGAFQDWGGEKNDLFTTQVRVLRRRRAAAFGLKGPGTRGKLTPKKMGANGDQIQRLFESPADVFLVQYWREIDQAILKEMEAFAVNRSLLTGAEILYGMIDGQDSRRIYEAYKGSF